MQKIEKIEINRIQPNPFQPRKNINQESIIELAKTIEQIGLLQPIIININNNNIVTLIAGQRRLEAYKYLNKEYIECIVIPGEADEEDLRKAALIENIQREEMTSYETALAVNELKKSGLTLIKISEQLGKSISWVSKMLSVLNLDEAVQEEIVKGNLEITKAAVIASQRDLSGEEQVKLANEVIENQITKKELEEKVKESLISEKPGFKEELYYDHNLLEELARKIEAKAEIKKNKLIIHFSNNYELEEILKILV